MHITNFVLKAIFSVAVVGISTLSFAHNGMDHSKMNHIEMKHAEMDHSQHSAQEHEQHMPMMEKTNPADHSAHMNHQQVQPAKDQQKDVTQKQQDKKVQKGDQHAQH